MSVVKMNKLSLVGLNSDKEDILKALMEFGALHLMDAAALTAEGEPQVRLRCGAEHQEVSALEEKMGKLSLILKHLEKYDKRKKGVFSARRLVSKKSCERVWQEQERLWGVVEAVVRCEQNMAHLQSEKNRYANLVASLEPWEMLDVPLSMRGTDATLVLMGYVPGKNKIGELEKEIEKVGPCCIKVLNQEREHTYLYLIYHHAVTEKLGAVLRQNGFTKVVFKDLEDTAQEHIRQAEEKIWKLEGKYKELQNEMAAYAEAIEELELLYDTIMIRRDRKQAHMQLVETENVFVLEGWIPARLGESLTGALQEKWTCVANVRQPSDQEEYPVLLENGAMGKSVEAITAMYSLPHVKEADPNFVMSLFFVFFYGLMMGDGVYGVTLILAAAFLLRKASLEESARNFVRLMLYCGISTVFWGALFGGWMGIPALSKYYLWMDPMESPEEFLGWSLLFGMLHIYVGMGVKAFNLFRQKRYLDILLDVVVWYVFFTGFILFVSPYVFPSENQGLQHLVDAGKNMLLAGAVIIVTTQGRKSKNIFLGLFAGFGKLYDLIKFTSDILSYSRLMALGLATTVIGFIVYEIAAMNGTDSLLKVIVFIVILLVGHMLNFAIAVLSAFVHASRLQYIEFFSRFYMGGGFPFRPLKTDTKFIYLQEE